MKEMLSDFACNNCHSLARVLVKIGAKKLLRISRVSFLAFNELYAKNFMRRYEKACVAFI